MSQFFKSCRTTSYIIKLFNIFCRTTYVFCNQLINYLVDRSLLKNTKPSVTSHGPHFFQSVLCDFGFSIFQYGPCNQLIDSIHGISVIFKYVKGYLLSATYQHCMILFFRHTLKPLIQQEPLRTKTEIKYAVSGSSQQNLHKNSHNSLKLRTRKTVNLSEQNS